MIALGKDRSLHHRRCLGCFLLGPTSAEEIRRGVKGGNSSTMVRNEKPPVVVKETAAFARLPYELRAQVLAALDPASRRVYRRLSLQHLSDYTVGFGRDLLASLLRALLLHWPTDLDPRYHPHIRQYLGTVNFWRLDRAHTAPCVHRLHIDTSYVRFAAILPYMHNLRTLDIRALSIPAKRWPDLFQRLRALPLQHLALRLGSGVRRGLLLQTETHQTLAYPPSQLSLHDSKPSTAILQTGDVTGTFRLSEITFLPSFITEDILRRVDVACFHESRRRLCQRLSVLSAPAGIPNGFGGPQVHRCKKYAVPLALAGDERTVAHIDDRCIVAKSPCL